MKALTAVITLGVLLIAGNPPAPDAQTIPGAGPPFTGVKATWAALWDRLLHGDVEGARRYVHSTRQHLFPADQTASDLQELARQMQFCRVLPNPLPIDPDEVMYPVRCEHGDETVETLMGLRRDRDGVWRLVTF